MFKCEGSEHPGENEEWIIFSNVSFTCCELFPAGHREVCTNSWFQTQRGEESGY